MATPRLRPRFECVVPAAPGEVRARLRSALDAPGCPCTGSILHGHVRLRIPRARRRSWSPQLELEAAPHPEGTLLQGRFGPHPSVWTFFVALYAVLAFVALGAGLFALSQWMLGQPRSALWVLGAAAVLFVLAYAVALSGRRLAQEQMRQLRTFVDHALGLQPA